MPDDQSKPVDVFLSHAHVDADVVEKLGARLEDESGLRVWLDKWVLVPGKPWQPEMAKAIEQAVRVRYALGIRPQPDGLIRRFNVL